MEFDSRDWERGTSLSKVIECCLIPEIKSRDVRGRLEFLGRLVGFEPTTSAATERRSATEL
jgi:hypothetical protein